MSNTSKIFVRGLWGYEDRKEYVYKRRKKISNDILLVQHNPFEQPFVTYVFGEDNYKFLIDEGFDCRLVDKNPMIWGHDRLKEHQYGHKLKIFQAATEEFNEIVFLDWDCMLAKPIHKNFWDIMGKKQEVQAILRGYKSCVCMWRKTDRRKRACASFVYVRGEEVGKNMFDMWYSGFDKYKSVKSRRLSEEQIISLYTDKIFGGWQGVRTYWKNFEPNFFLLGKHEVPFQPYPNTWLLKKKRCFVHINRQNSGSAIKMLRQSNLTDVEKKEKIIEFLDLQLQKTVIQDAKKSIVMEQKIKKGQI